MRSSPFFFNSTFFFQWPTPSSLRQITQIHGQILTTGAQLHKPVLTRLLKLLTDQEIGQLSYALTLFSQIPQPSTFEWNIIIMSSSSFGTSGCSSFPITLYRQMRRQGGAVHNEFTFRFLFKACGVGSLKLEGQMVQGCYIRCFGELGKFVGSSLVHMYARFGWLSDAKKVFDAVCSKDEMLWTTMVGGYTKNGCIVEAKKLFDEMPTKNLVSWTSMVAGCSQRGQPEEALKYFKGMMEGGIMPDSVTMVSTLSACAQTRNLETGKQVHAIVVRERIAVSENLAAALIDMYAKCGDMSSARQIFDDVGWRHRATWNAIIDGYSKLGDIETARSFFNRMENRDCVSFNSMITGYVQSSQLKEVLSLFAEMRESRIEPDSFTMAGLITACADQSVLNLGRSLHTLVIVSTCTELDVYIGTSLIDMYAKCGRIDDALQVFSRMHQKDAFLWTAIISGLAMHGNGTMALEYFSSMQKDGIPPNAVSYVGVLNACSHSGLLEEGRKHFREMKCLHNIEPEIEHYGCMVDLLGRCGCLSEAEELINRMPMEPSPLIWTSLLGACRIHKALDMAERAATNILSLEPYDDGVYVQMYNMYVNCGRWSSASDIRQLMEKRGIRKVVGCSSVVVRNVVHEFLAGDRSHPEILEIQKMLVEMNQRLKIAGYSAGTSRITEDMDEEEKDSFFSGHSERIAIAYGIMRLGKNLPIHVIKNLRICEDCHSAIKMIAKLWNREIVVRDRGRFHRFRDGQCSCNGFW